MTKFVTRLLFALTVIVGAAYYSDAQTVSPILQPHQTFVDSAGAPCAGCSLYTYAAGTSTPQATYTDSTGGTPNTNPIVLDAAGGATIWLSANSYKFVLKDALGSTIWSADNISGLTAPLIPPTNGTAFGSVSKGWDLYARNLTVSGTFSPSVISGNPSFPGNVSIGGSLSGSTLSLSGTASLQNATVKNLGGTRYADQYAGVDACAKINAASLASSPGGILFATGFTGTQACASNPLASSPTSGGILQLGLTTYQTTATWNVTQNWQIKGVGLGGSVIQAASIAANPLVTLGTASGNQGTNISNIEIDCNGQTGLVGLQNQNVQELSDIQNVAVSNCPSIGIDLETAGAQNMGIYHSEVNYYTSSPGVATAGTIPVKINVNAPIRGIHGLTVDATGQTTPPNVGILINSQGTYEDIHCEGVVTCISVTTDDVVIHDVQCSANVTNCISLGASVKNVIIESITTGGTNALVDATNGNTLTNITDPSGVGWYITGSSGATPGACSSSASVTCNAFSAMTLSGTLGVTGLTTATGGIKVGASGSTITDSRNLVQSVSSCGAGTTCSNAAWNNSRIIIGTVTLTTGAATVSGISPAFASSSSFVCSANDNTTQTNLANCKPGSSSSIACVGTGTDVIAYTCVGN